MSNLRDVSDKELKKELERREKIHRTAPAPATTPDRDKLRQVREMVAGFVADTIAGKYVDEDLRQYVFEACVEMWYDKGIWKYLYPKRAENG